MLHLTLDCSQNHLRSGDPSVPRPGLQTPHRYTGDIVYPHREVCFGSYYFSLISFVMIPLLMPYLVLYLLFIPFHSVPAKSL